jgi:proteic killer suppression protein
MKECVDCPVTLYGLGTDLIKSWKHKGLQEFFESENHQGVQYKHVRRLKMQLSLLHAAVAATDLNLPGYKFHPLIGDKKGLYSITINGNWRLTFGFEGENATEVNYQDYH